MQQQQKKKITWNEKTKTCIARGWNECVQVSAVGSGQ